MEQPKIFVEGTLRGLRAWVTDQPATRPDRVVVWVEGYNRPIEVARAELAPAPARLLEREAV